MSEDFDWSLGESAEATSTENGVVEEVHEPGVSDQGDRQRDANGRFVASKADEGVAGGDDADGEADEQVGDLILGKFKSVDDLVAAYQNAEQRLGSQGNELGELRKAVEALSEKLPEHTEQQQYAPVDENTVSALDELAEANPQQAAIWALQNQPVLYDRVMEIWFANDPRSAGRFENGLALAQIEQKISQQVAPFQADTQQRQFAVAWSNVAAKHPDFASLETGIQEAAEAAPELAQALQTGDVAAKERLIENLYRLAKGMQADTLAAAAAEKAKQQSSQTEAEKLKAGVASASAAQSRGEKGGIQSWKEKAFLDAPATSIWEGLERAK